MSRRRTQRPTGPPWPYLLLAGGIGVSGLGGFAGDTGLAGFGSQLIAVALVFIAQQRKNGRRDE